MSSSSKVLSLITQTKPEKQVIPGRKLNTPVVRRTRTGDIGLEFEIEGRRLLTNGYLDGVVGKKSEAFWEVKTDGSLRNGGREYVLSTPCFYEELEPLIKGLFKRFDDHGSKIKLSNRCSTHVHYNVGGLRVNQITSILALWYLFEEPLIRWWGTERVHNHFCLSSKDEEGSVEAWINFLKTGYLPETNGLKYSALNLLTIATFGSVEFRAGGGVDNPEKALTWAKFLYTLCKYAEVNYPSPFQIAYDMSERGAETILKAICDTCFGKDDNTFFQQVYETVDHFQAACMESFRNAQPFIMGFPWDEWLEQINKEYVPDPFTSPKKIKDSTPPPIRNRLVTNNEVREFENTFLRSRRGLVRTERVDWTEIINRTENN